MKKLVKNVELGVYKFNVVTDRDVAVRAFEQYPDVIEYILNNENNALDDTQIFINAIKKKELNALFEMEEKLAKLVEFVLPIMLKKADENIDSKTIIEYATENDVIDDFNAGIIEFLFLGFMQRGLGNPKIKFSMN